MSSSTAGSFTDHPRKVLFRSKWAKPILKYLHDRLQKKLVYLGLPGIRALDILSWQEYLRFVIAFQAENYDGRLAENAGISELDELQAILNDLETKRIIDTYALYTGYIEQVVMSGEDDYNNPFEVHDYITVYNLDFCNTLSTPFQVVGPPPKYKTYDCYKIDVIERLLSLERDRFTSGADASFVMFLTVNAHFVESMVNSISEVEVKQYVSKDLRGITGDKRVIRLLKAYTFYKLNELFKKYGFHLEMFPAIYYKGSGTYYDEKRNKDVPFWLTTFTVLGTPIQLNNPKIEFGQSFGDFVRQKFVFINDKEITCFTEERLQERDYDPDIDRILASSYTLNKLWKSN